MDLPTCPSCGQSVLDEGVEDCPFCGASMTGKPSARKAKSPSAAAAARQASKKEPSKTGKTAAKAGPGRRAAPAAKRTEQADDDPFSVDTSASQRAVPLAPKPSRGRTFKVVCPMCETAGYTSRKAAGKEVRCANSECLVPVFTAPRPPKKTDTEQADTQGHSRLLLFALAGAVLVAAGLSVWYFVLRPDEPASLPAPDYTSQLGGSSGAEGNDETPRQSPTDDAQPEVEKTLTLAEIEGRALEAMIEASQQRERNRNKPFCRRLTACAFALTGDLDAAREQLNQMGRLRQRIPYYYIPPLVEFAWQQLAAGQAEAAGEVLEQALGLASDLPNYGRDRLDVATISASALVAGGRAAEARELIERHQDAGTLGQMSADLVAARALGSYDTDYEAEAGPIYPYAFPQSTAVTVDLVGHGRADEALAWAENLGDAEARSEAVTAWAESLIRLREPAEAGQVERAVAKLGPAGRARLYSRIALRQAEAGDGEAAEESLGKAREVLASLQPPAESALPGMKRVIMYRLPDPAPLKTAALAAAAVARVEARLGQTDQAWNSVQRALEYSRAMAPNLPAVERRINEITDQGVAVIRSRLKEELNLNSNDAARLRFNDYRRKLRSLQAGARRRFDLQAELLAAAVRWGLLEPVWNEINDRRLRSDVQEREPWLETAVPWLLFHACRQAGDEKTARLVLTALENARARPEPDIEIVNRATRLIADGELKRAAELFDQYRDQQGDDDWRDRWRLRLACRLAADGSFSNSIQFVKAFHDNDAPLRETALELIGALATRRGKANEIWEAGQSPALTPTEVVSLYRGLVDAAARFSSPASQETAAASGGT